MFTQEKSFWPPSSSQLMEAAALPASTQLAVHRDGAVERKISQEARTPRGASQLLSLQLSRSTLGGHLLLPIAAHA